MFGLFKNKDKQKKTSQPDVPEQTLSAEQKETLSKEIEEIDRELEQASETDKTTLATLYEKKGLKQAALDQKDQAVTSLEKSLEYKLSIGDGYKKLMNLYNAKRAEAARNGNDEDIDYYMNKMDEMRQIAKKGTTSR